AGVARPPTEGSLSMTPAPADPGRLAEIAAQVRAGARLSFDDGLYLDTHADLFTLGELANLVRERKNGNVTYYNVNTHLNPTNVCVYRCTFCAFRADLKSPKGYVMSDEQILERAAEAEERGATELHIVGGLHHQLPYEWYLQVVRIIHREHPRLHLKAYTAVEWDWFERLTGRPTRDLLAEFQDAGLGSLPGGGAEIFHPEVRDKICEHKADAGAWLRIHREAHQLALSYGADDLDGTVVHEKIYHDAGSDSPQEIGVATIRRLIEEAGRVPVERDTLYHEVVRENGHWRAGLALAGQTA